MSDTDDVKDWRYLPPRGLAAIGPEDYIRERISAENSSTLNVLTVAAKAHDGAQQPADGAGGT